MLKKIDELVRLLNVKVYEPNHELHPLRHFCAMVEEMSEQVQFIIISHNKITIETAINLNGVTMHEPGVSRLVSVDVGEAVELAEAL